MASYTKRTTTERPRVARAGGVTADFRGQSDSTSPSAGAAVRCRCAMHRSSVPIRSMAYRCAARGRFVPSRQDQEQHSRSDRARINSLIRRARGAPARQGKRIHLGGEAPGMGNSSSTLYEYTVSKPRIRFRQRPVQDRWTTERFHQPSARPSRSSAIADRDRAPALWPRRCDSNCRRRSCGHNDAGPRR